VWKSTEEQPDRYAFWFVGKSKQTDVASGALEVVTVEKARDNFVLTNGRMPFFTTSLAGNNYLNFFVLTGPFVAAIGSKSMPMSYEYFLAKYTVEGDRLTIWPIDTDAVRAAIKRGDLKGEVRGNEPWETITLTSSTAELPQYIQQRGDRILFPRIRTATFERLAH
jgi:hypothetical protein